MNTAIRMSAAALLFAALCCLAGTAMAQDRPMDILFESVDTDHNGSISEQEWHASMQKRFESQDANHDGNLSREELEQARSNLRQSLRERWQNRRNTTAQ